MKNLLITIIAGLLIAASAGAQTPNQLSADLTADFITACQQGPDAFDNFEQCIAGATAARDDAVRTAREIQSCLTLPTANEQSKCLENINQ